MKRRPRHTKHGIVGGRDVIFIMFNAAFITAAVTCAYLVGTSMGGIDKGRTMAFVTLAVDELWRSFNFRSERSNFWQINPLTNKYLLLACLSSILIVVATIAFEPLRHIFGNTPLSAREWQIVILFSLVPFAANECWTLVRRYMGRAWEQTNFASGS